VNKTSEYTFEYYQLFNCFGAPGIPNTYRCLLYRDGETVAVRDIGLEWRAIRQCRRWVDLYGAKAV
jgi:hypothetical protein